MSIYNLHLKILPVVLSFLQQSTMIVRFNLKLILSFLTLLVCVNSWKKCTSNDPNEKIVDFCSRIRKKPEGYPSYLLNLQSVKVTDNVVHAELISPPPGKNKLLFTLEALGDSTFHIVIDDATPNSLRHKAKRVLDEVNPPVTIPIKDVITNDRIVTVNYEIFKAVIYVQPFKVEFYKDDQLISTINDQDRLVFETETDKTAIGLDISFPGAQRAYGIPQHAEHLALRTTVLDQDQPYRHFNLDYGRYAVWSTEALYGSIPVLYAHATSHSSGVFWLNAAQTWVDLQIAPNKVDAYFMSESGVMEIFVLPGPTLAETVKQYSKLTGVAPLPQYFTLGYHQSRYSYMSQDEVTSLVKNFDENNFPVDVVWLDIDYTDEKKYFTWDSKRFSDPEGMIKQLAETNRKLVAIIDPHIKVDPEYFLHKNATEKGYYVKASGGGDFVGDCWPGRSSWLDFFNPEALTYYSSLYNDYHFELKNVHVWNDMNEPAVFNADVDENTMPSNALHYSGRKHLDVHNMYGFYQTIGTHEGLMQREVKVRPFILTRSHFAGVQRYAAIWTGDNAATWEYLKVSYPMCLTEALAGVSFCGADIGGFALIPDDELYQRWYQAGAWLPFYRGHSAIDVPRREPYLYSGDVQARIRTAIQQRYTHLPVWYTLFREHELTGEPVIRPITYQYPSEADALSIDNQILVGENILVAPVMEPGVFMKSVYLPGGKSEIWYNIDNNYELLRGTGHHTINVTLDSVPVFYRGGSIITRKDKPRPTTVDTHQDPYTVYICLDAENNAQGSIYVDDYESFEYKNSNSYLYVGLTFADKILSNHKLQNGTNYDGAASITQAVIMKPPENIGGARFTPGGTDEAFEVKVIYSEDKSILNVIGFSASLQQEFKLELY